MRSPSTSTHSPCGGNDFSTLRATKWVNSAAAASSIRSTKTMASSRVMGSAWHFAAAREAQRPVAQRRELQREQVQQVVLVDAPGLAGPLARQFTGGALHVARAQVEGRPGLARIRIEHGHADVQPLLAHVVEDAADLSRDQLA